MRFVNVRVLSIVLVLFAAAPTMESHAAEPASRTTFGALVDSFLAEYYADNPTYAGDLGLHEFDSRIEDVSQTAILAEAGRIKRWQQQFTAVDPGTLGLTERLDREFLLRDLEARLIGIEDVRAWARDPDPYSSGLTNSAFALIKRDYA